MFKLYSIKYVYPTPLFLSPTPRFCSLSLTPRPSPKCRHQYTPQQTPTRYYCYCGKELEPEPDPWLLPHSCGQVCDREFKPPCGHRCLLLCHPGTHTNTLSYSCTTQNLLKNNSLCVCMFVLGPCPPCPKMVSVSCVCGKAAPVPRRCSNKAWTCGKVCCRTLPCKIHTCAHTCHAGNTQASAETSPFTLVHLLYYIYKAHLHWLISPLTGECEPCPRVSVQNCVCGRRKTERQCASPVWQCDLVTFDLSHFKCFLSSISCF